MDWVKGFYSRTGSWWGRGAARVTERDHARVRVLRALAGPGPLRVLELGSGYGMTAVAAVRDGCRVTAVEISDRAAHTPGTPGLALLLDGTGLRLTGIVGGGQRFPVEARPGWAPLLAEHPEYTAVLVAAGQ